MEAMMKLAPRLVCLPKPLIAVVNIKGNKQLSAKRSRQPMATAAFPRTAIATPENKTTITRKAARTKRGLTNLQA